MIKLLIAQPNGFCAGVERAIQIVKLALERFGSPVYVKHAIVHNTYVVDELKLQGAIFVDNVSDVPDGAIIITSAHGIAIKVRDEIQSRDLQYIDSTCPLVTKVHNQVKIAEKKGESIIFIGHRNHPETIGTCGQTNNSIQLVETLEDIPKLIIYEKMAILTQTTLSITDTEAIINAIKKRIPHIREPKSKDICYATENRQNAIRSIAPLVDYLFVFGSLSSSNSNRLVEIGRENGCKNSILCYDKNQIDIRRLGDNKTIGISGGASCPGYIVNDFVTTCQNTFETKIEYHTVAIEDIYFRLPLMLAKKSVKRDDA